MIPSVSDPVHRPTTARPLFALSRRLLCAAVMLGAAGCMTPVDAPPVAVVFFTPFSADLDQEAKSVITEVAKDARANPSRTIVVKGYADSIGTPAANRTLSQLRAQVVADGLVSQGVSAGSIVQRPRGPTAADPGIESRRVEITFGR